MAKLVFKFGSMGSSKTANLLIQAYNFDEKDINILCLKPGIDDRSGINIIKSRIPGLQRECLTIYDKWFILIKVSIFRLLFLINNNLFLKQSQSI